MSDTYNYNSGSPACGMGGFLGNFGCNNWMDLIALVVVGGLFGFGGFGGNGWGARGMMPGGGQVMADATAATTAALISSQNTADRVASIGADVQQILGQTGGIIEAVNTVGNRAQDGFARLDTNLCQLGHAQSMQAVNNYNGLTSQLTDMRFASQQCCCDTKQLIQSSFCDLRHQMQADKCETLGAIAASEARVIAKMNDAEKAALTEKLNACHERELALQAKLDNRNNTDTLLAAIKAGNGCCGTVNSSCCVQNPCAVLTNALYTDWVNKTLNPTTAATTA